MPARLCPSIPEVLYLQQYKASTDSLNFFLFLSFFDWTALCLLHLQDECANNAWKLLFFYQRLDSRPSRLVSPLHLPNRNTPFYCHPAFFFCSKPIPSIRSVYAN